MPSGAWKRPPWWLHWLCSPASRGKPTTCSRTAFDARSPSPHSGRDAQRMREGFGNSVAFCRVLYAVALHVRVLRLEHGRVVGIAEPDWNAVVMCRRDQQASCRGSRCRAACGADRSSARQDVTRLVMTIEPQGWSLTGNDKRAPVGSPLSSTWWAVQVSNLRPPRCQRGVLPLN